MATRSTSGQAKAKTARRRAGTAQGRGSGHAAQASARDAQASAHEATHDTPHGDPTTRGRRRAAAAADRAPAANPTGPSSAAHAAGASAHGARPSSAADAAAAHESPAGTGSAGARSRMPRPLTAEQAIEAYRANARLALDVIDAAIDGAERVRRKQFEGEQQARALSRKHAHAAASATDPQALLAAGHGAAHEAVETSLRYWQEMFELIAEIQRRLFALLTEEAQALPGAREAQAAMALMPDLGAMHKVIEAMQAMVSSGGNAFEGMQRAMSAFAPQAPQRRTER